MANIENLLKRGNAALEEEKWDEAENFFERVLDENMEESRAYLGKLLVEYKLSREESLLNFTSQINENGNYKKAYRYGNEEFKSKLDNYADQITNNIAKHMYDSDNISSFEKTKKESIQ